MFFLKIHAHLLILLALFVLIQCVQPIDATGATAQPVELADAVVYEQGGISLGFDANLEGSSEGITGIDGNGHSDQLPEAASVHPSSEKEVDRPIYPLTAISLTFLAGGAATLGGLFVLCLGAPSPRTLSHSLSFAAGIMLYVSFGDLIPHAIHDLDAHTTTDDHDHHHHHNHDHHDHEHDHSHGQGFFLANMWMFGGMLFFAVASQIVKRMGDSHGHSHGPDFLSLDTSDSGDATTTTATNKESGNTKEHNDENEGTTDDRNASPVTTTANTTVSKKNLFMTGMVAALGISLHNLPEGLIVYNQTIHGLCDEEYDPSMSWYSLPKDFRNCMTRGLAVTIAIALHNIPEGIAVASPIFAATGSAYQALLWTAVSSAAEPIAAIIAGSLLAPYLTPVLMAKINAGVAGIMIALSVGELIPTAASLASYQEVVYSNILGQFVMFASLELMARAGMH